MPLPGTWKPKFARFMFLIPFYPSLHTFMYDDLIVFHVIVPVIILYLCGSRNMLFPLMGFILHINCITLDHIFFYNIVKLAEQI